jgi:serine/threonine protein kinase
MRQQPRESFSRQWTVLPATVGLTEFQEGRPTGRPDQTPGEPAARDPLGLADQGGRGAPRLQPPTDVAPAKVGNYVLEERLGAGGMGDVYRARHSQFGRVRAVKVIRQHFVDTGHQEVIRRFYQEIKAVGALEHPNIVVAIDSSAPTDAVHYLVMEFIDGIGADELVARQGAMAIADACEIARQAARGLAYIHQHGMVHRDIKPSNLMLTLLRADAVAGFTEAGDKAEPQAVVKILDLGLALLVGDDQQRLTLFDHRAMGTAMYMSPEQWKTTSVDIRADIYSLGCTLYHLLAGKPPFWESDLKPEKAHEREKLPPIRHPEGTREPIPRPLWDVLKKMTAKNPEERFADPGEVAAALTPFAEGHQLPQRIEEMTRKSRSSLTEGFSKTETMIARSAESDTRPGRTPASWGLPKTLPPAQRQKIGRVMAALLTIAAVLAIGWLAWEATGRRESVQVAREARGHALQVAAGFAASEILKEIRQRFDILDRLAAEDELRQEMNQILRSPDNEANWTSLENWLGARKADYEREAPADSWFINDVRGVQVARSPRSEASRGGNYAHRDYFHGQGMDLPENTPNLRPITGAHLSAVYRSTSSGHLKVAFSVPIENGLRGKDRGIVGVLAMSVDLGEFNVLEKQLPPGHEVVLIDLRESNVDGQTRRGLVLHHQMEIAYERGESPPWVGTELLAQIDRQLSIPAVNRADGGTNLLEYHDEALTRGRPYWGALRPVIDRRPDEQVFDTRWVVLVQEPMSR